MNKNSSSLRIGRKFNVAIVVAVYNVEDMLVSVLNSIRKQRYPIHEIIIIDNKSTDNSVKVAEKYSRKYPKLNIKIIQRDKTYGISFTYNLGIRLAKSDYVVMVHSDSIIETPYELEKLLRPFNEKSDTIATYPIVIHPLSVWKKYNFWQKCLFATVAGTAVPSGNGKFDCYKKNAFLKAGGYDEIQFAHDMGTEDADMYIRLSKEGKVIPSTARVIHLHGIDKNYSLEDWINRRRFLSISYGRYLQLHAKDIKWQALLFFIKPLLAMTGFFTIFYPALLLLLVAFPFFYMPRMFVTRMTLLDQRILLLPFIIIYLIYYESYWFLYSYLFLKQDK